MEEDRMLSDEILLGLINKKGGGGGTSNYNDLANLPQIGGVTLQGNKSLGDLGIKNEFIGTKAQWDALTEDQKKAYDTYQITDDYTEGIGGLTFGNFTGITSAYGVLSPSPTISVDDNFIIGAFGNGSYVVIPFVASSDNTWRFMVLQSDTIRPLAEQSAIVNYALVKR